MCVRYKNNFNCGELIGPCEQSFPSEQFFSKPCSSFNRQSEKTRPVLGHFRNCRTGFFPLNKKFMKNRGRNLNMDEKIGLKKQGF